MDGWSNTRNWDDSYMLECNYFLCDMKQCFVDNCGYVEGAIFLKTYANFQFT